MITADKIPGETFAFWTAILVVVLLISNYGGKIISWILMKLYDFFIGGNNHATPVT